MTEALKEVESSASILIKILDVDLVYEANENYILISEEDPVARINFINKFGDKTDFQINIKKILDNNDRE